MSNFQIDITYTHNNPIASWSLDGGQPTPIKAKAGDTVSFSFPDPASLSNVLLLTGPRKKEIAPSPFEGGTQLNIDPDAELAIENVTGLWGFALTFTVIKNGVSSFYFLPDPELEVGSN